MKIIKLSKHALASLAIAVFGVGVAAVPVATFADGSCSSTQTSTVTQNGSTTTTTVTQNGCGTSCVQHTVVVTNGVTTSDYYSACPAFTATSKSFAGTVSQDSCVGSAQAGCTITVVDTKQVSRVVQLVPGGKYYGFTPSQNIVGKKVSVYAFQTGPYTYNLSGIGNFVNAY